MSRFAEYLSHVGSLATRLAIARRTGAALAVVFCAAAALLVLCEPAVACPTCKVALANHDPHHGDIVSGYFWSILFMLSMPPSILGGLAGVFYWEVRKARASGGGPSRGGQPT